MSRGRVPVGRASQARRAAGGKQALGRPSLPVAEWLQTVKEVQERARYRCEIRISDHPGVDPHHVVPRSMGGSDLPENVIFLCRWHHDMVDRAFKAGRLVIEKLDGGCFAWRIVRKANKWATDEEVLAEGRTDKA